MRWEFEPESRIDIFFFHFYVIALCLYLSEGGIIPYVVFFQYFLNVLSVTLSFIPVIMHLHESVSVANSFSILCPIKWVVRIRILHLLDNNKGARIWQLGIFLTYKLRNIIIHFYSFLPLHMGCSSPIPANFNKKNFVTQHGFCFAPIRSLFIMHVFVFNEYSYTTFLLIYTLHVIYLYIRIYIFSPSQ